MAKKESVLSEKEKESFEIEKFIFHIIDQENVNPVYLDEITLDPDQSIFFKNRLKDISEGVQHIFKDKLTSSFFSDCSLLLADPEKHLIDISKKITASFKGFHGKNTNNGVFITTVVKVSNLRHLIFFLKVDHKKVYEYKIKGKKALLTEITQTFIEDKKAIQKAALIDISDYYMWDVLAFDRTASGKKALTDYFANFLTVQEKETPSTLTTKVIKAVRTWAIANKEMLNLGQDVSYFKNRVISYLDGAAKYKTKDCLDAIIDDDDEIRRSNQIKSLKSFFDEEGLSGQSFAPSKSRLDRSAKKNIRETAEGVKIIWEGEATDLNIDIPNLKNPNDGLFHIVIKTSKIEILDKD